LLLLTFTIGMFSSGVYAAEPIDTDGDGVPDSVDFCPNLLEDYDPPSESAVNLLSNIESGQPSSS